MTEQKNIPRSWIERINILKTTIILKVIYTFNEISVKIPMAFFTDLEQIVIFFMQTKHKRSQISKTILKKMNKTEYIMLPDFKLYYKALQYPSSVILAKTDPQINGTE